jgi:hypothetical protein
VCGCTVARSRAATQRDLRVDGDDTEWQRLLGVELDYRRDLSIRVRPRLRGYWLAGEDGSVFTFGGANFFRTLSGLGVHGHVVAIAARNSSPPG